MATSRLKLETLQLKTNSLPTDLVNHSDQSVVGWFSRSMAVLSLLGLPITHNKNNWVYNKNFDITRS